MITPYYAASGIALRRDNTAANDTPGETRWVENQDANGNPDGTMHLEMRLFNNTGGALVKGRPYIITPTGVVATNLAVVVPTTLAAIPRRYVVATDTTADQNYAWFAVAGYVDVNSISLTAAHFVKLAPATSAIALVDDGTTQTASSSGTSTVTVGAGPGLARVYLWGDLASCV